VIRYPSLEDVIALNVELSEGTGGVRELPVVESAVFRPQHGFGGQDAFPTIWDKAAALLHGLASTQGFHDGNKRTAWVATEAFLALNGHMLPDMADIEAEAFVMAVAVSAWTDRTVAKAAEWLELQTSRGPRRHPQLDFAFLARGGAAEDDGTFSVLKGDLATVAAPVLPVPLQVHLICRVTWTPADEGSPHTVTASVLPENADEAIGQAAWTWVPPVRGGHAHHPYGLMPSVADLPLLMLLEQPGPHRVLLHLDDVLLTELPLNVVVSQLLA
jgi:death-on-curing protein